MEKTFDEDSKDQKEIETLGLIKQQYRKKKKTLDNLINQQVMNKYSNHGYIISQLLDCGVDKSLMLE